MGICNYLRNYACIESLLQCRNEIGRLMQSLKESQGICSKFIASCSFYAIGYIETLQVPGKE